MPAVSKGQFRLFAKAKSDPKFRKKMGISEETAKEFTPSGTYSKLPEKKKPKPRGR
jgi:hypothetical protein